MLNEAEGMLQVVQGQMARIYSQGQAIATERRNRKRVARAYRAREKKATEETTGRSNREEDEAMKKVQQAVENENAEEMEWKASTPPET